MSKDDFFVGWADTPEADRRFFLRAGLGLMAGTAAIAGSLAAFQKRPGPGTWDMGTVREFRGVATASPYAMLRTTDVDGTPKTVLLGCQGKCGVSARIGSLAGKPVVVKGSLIQRGSHAMIAVIDGVDWISEDAGAASSGLEFPQAEVLREVSLKGEILDTKCWFGAMRPSEGKAHKACASLCIRSGLPPGFYIKDIREQSALLILTEQDQGFGPDLLKYVGEPVHLSGTAKRAGDLLFLDTSTANIRFT